MSLVLNPFSHQDSATSYSSERSQLHSCVQLDQLFLAATVVRTCCMISCSYSQACTQGVQESSAMDPSFKCHICYSVKLKLVVAKQENYYEHSFSKSMFWLFLFAADC